jgi:C4-dicarboxylate transporter, DctM subunit
MAQRLIRLMTALTARVPAGLALATILSCAVFAAISGSGTITLLAMGSVLYPALLRAGYPASFAMGVLCAGGTLGVIIPPSIPLILYGVMTQTSIPELFIAGVGPGLLLTGLFAGYSLLRFSHLRTGAWNGAELVSALRASLWALLLPVIILGGIYTGYFTATESAGVAVVYVVLVETLAHRELGLAGLRAAVLETGQLLGALFPVLMVAFSLNVFLTYQQIPEQLVSLMTGTVHSPAVFVLMVNVLLLLVGCLVDIGSAVLILAPLLLPLAEAQGMDAVHMGVLMVMNLEIGYLTPPMGMNLIVAMIAFRESFWSICRAVVPFIGLMLIGLAVVSYWPELVLWRR